MRLSELEAVVESLLFLSGDAVPLKMIAQTIELDKATTRAIILSLREKYEAENRGLRIVEFEEAYQMCTASNCFEYIRLMYQAPIQRGLSQALLETLAIVAYKQPVTRGVIEDIRGVNVGTAIYKLMEKKLICEVGRDESAGRPILFGTTKQFLRYFGFESVEQLPHLKENEEIQLEYEVDAIQSEEVSESNTAERNIHRIKS